jgi:hypothetical protein
LKFPFIPCNQKYTSDVDEYNYPVNPDQECGCNECEESCGNIDWDNILENKSLFNGLSINILLLFGFLILVSIFLIFGLIVSPKTIMQVIRVDLLWTVLNISKKIYTIIN